VIGNGVVLSRQKSVWHSDKLYGAMMNRQRNQTTGAHQSSLFGLPDWTAVPLRLIVGYGFMEHGYAKLARGGEHFVGLLQAIGVPEPNLMGWLTILVELVGGFAVLIGAFVPLVSVPMAAILVVAALTVHLPYGFSSIKLQAVTAAGAQFGPPGYETDLLYLACLGALILGGSGPFSIDGLLSSIRTRATRSRDLRTRDQRG
jgi:putative oxidoreductase